MKNNITHIPLRLPLSWPKRLIHGSPVRLVLHARHQQGDVKRRLASPQVIRGASLGGLRGVGPRG